MRVTEEQLHEDIVARVCVLALMNNLRDMEVHHHGKIDHSSIDIAIIVKSEEAE